jgi:hypothetical protein
MKSFVVVLAGFVAGMSLVFVYLAHFRPDSAATHTSGQLLATGAYAPATKTSPLGSSQEGMEEFEEYLAAATGTQKTKQLYKNAKGASESGSGPASSVKEPQVKAAPLQEVKPKMEQEQPPATFEDFHWAEKEESNVFLPLVLKAVTKANMMVLFTGRSVKNIFDTPLPHSASVGVSTASTSARERMAMYRHVTLTGHVRTRLWSDIALKVNETARWNHANYTTTTPTTDDTQPLVAVNKAVRVHNEHIVGDLLLHIVSEAKIRRRLTGTLRSLGNSLITPAEIKAEMDKGQPPVVITNSVDENWGFLSTGINTRTTEWINMTNHLRIHESNYATIHAFLDSDKVVLMAVNTHIAPEIGAHPKVISLPLGFREMGKNWNKAREMLKKGVKKVRLMQINNSGWGDRAVINEDMKRVFRGTVHNTYANAKTINDTDRGMGGPVDRAKQRRERQERQRKRKEAEALAAASAGGKKRRRHTLRRRLQQQQQQHQGKQASFDHMRETAESRFALCPSGLGMDTYRLWQTLLMGTIPVVESNPGFDRTYARLPVLVVRNYTDLTPGLLRRAYPCFRDNADKFDYRALTLPYWLELVDTAVRTGNVDHVTRQHPYRNAYCDFLSS